MVARSILITGASSGIGQSLARDLAAAGWKVYGSVRRDSDATALEALTPAGAPSIEALRFDVRDDETVRLAMADLATRLGDTGLDGLINNAGISVAAPLEYIPLEDFRDQLEINLTGALRVTQACLPMLRKARGRIVNVSSASGRVAFPILGAYVASKFALEGLSDTLRLELKPYGISVSVLEPGSLATPIWRTAGGRAQDIAARMSKQAYEDYRAPIEQMQAYTAKQGDDFEDPSLCTRPVLHALTARRPRTRYVVGRDARRLLFLRRWFLSDRMLDRLTFRAMGLD